MNYQLLAGAIVFLWSAPFSQYAVAQQRCAPEDSVQMCLCGGDEPDTARFFPEAREQAIAVRDLLCEGSDPADVVAEFETMLADHVDTWFESYGGFTESDPLQLIFDKRELVIGSPYPKYSNMNTSANQKGLVIVAGVTFKPEDVSRCPSGQCTPVLREFANYYNYAQSTVSGERTREYRQYVTETRTQWEEFFGVSRSMTPLELAVNSFAFDTNDQPGFSGPPPFQYIVLHPSPVIENFRGSPDGKNVEEALMLEIIGVNAWRWNKWYSPTGGSIIAVFADRAENDDVGYGVTLHFGPKYSFGAVRRDDDTGLVFSIDFLKFVENRQEVLSVLAKSQPTD